MAKRRGKRKSRTEQLRARAAKAQGLIARIIDMVRGGNPMGVGEYTLVVARGPENMMG
jgi:hypothetical protein